MKFSVETPKINPLKFLVTECLNLCLNSHLLNFEECLALAYFTITVQVGSQLVFVKVRQLSSTQQQCGRVAGFHFGLTNTRMKNKQKVFIFTRNSRKIKQFFPKTFVKCETNASPIKNKSFLWVYKHLPVHHFFNNKNPLLNI